MKENNIQFIYWFAYYNLNSPSVRYRAKYPLDFLKKEAGINHYLVVPGYSPSEIINFLRAYFSALIFRKSNSLIVIQKVQSDFIYANLLKLLVLLKKYNTIYDIDDADYFETKPQTIYFFSKHCHKISAGSKEIINHLKRFNSNIIHTSSPVVNLNIIKEKRNKVLTIGWIGGFGGGHKESLIQLVFPALKEITFKIKFIIIGIQNKEDNVLINQYFSENTNIILEIPEAINWLDEKNIQNRIVAFDLGIATLLNNPLQLSKSGIKAKQYLNNGIPVLSTNLSENNSVIINGHNGYFCSDASEFKNRIIEFKNMSDEDYFRFSENARNSIINFDHQAYFNALQQLNSLK